VWTIKDCSQEGHLNGLSLDMNDRIIHCCIRSGKGVTRSSRGSRIHGCWRVGPQTTLDLLCKCFADLIPLQMLILDTSLVISQPFDCNSLFSFVESLGSHRTIWKEYHHHYTPYTAESSDDEKFEFPGRQTCFDVPNSGRCQLVRQSKRLDNTYP
jgi:hypothetical protein